MSNVLKGIINWPKVPEWAEWVAQDADGLVFAYEAMPNIVSGLGWDGGSGCRERLGYQNLSE